MKRELEQPPQEPSTHFLEWLMYAQLQFETERVGTDGSLWDMNTLEYGLQRGIIGEATEALEEVKAGNIEKATEEVIDVIIFLGSILVHLGINATAILDTLVHKIESMQEKYKKEHFIGKTVAQGMSLSREIYNSQKVKEFA